MPEAIAAASAERMAEMVRLFVDRAVANGTEGLTGIDWTTPAAPFFRTVL